MRLLILILFSSVFGAIAKAAIQEDKIKIVSNVTTSTREILFNLSKNQEKQANFVIIDELGNEVKSFKREINKGLNAVCLEEALDLKEGIYTMMTVKKKAFSTKFVLFN